MSDGSDGMEADPFEESQAFMLDLLVRQMDAAKTEMRLGLSLMLILSLMRF